MRKVDLKKRATSIKIGLLMDAQELIPHLGVWPTGPGPLQHKLARGLVDAIRKGAVHPGIRLPSERTLAQALSISRTTVVAAYDALRESG